MMPDFVNQYEIHKRFVSFDEWRSWHPSHPEITDRLLANSLVAQILKAGFHDPLTSMMADPSSIIRGESLGEGMVYDGLNSRMRAVLFELNKVQKNLGIGREDLRIYAPEALTQFALRLRGYFRFFIGSEYFPCFEQRMKYFPIRHEDIQRFSFPENSFDVVICNDIFEHLPDIDLSLRELRRVLRPGGVMLATFPFCFHSYDSTIKARLSEGGLVEYLTSPEYHGNPASPDEGALVYEIPGWNIIDRSLNAGYKKAEMIFMGSRKYGILADHLNGVFVYKAKK